MVVGSGSGILSTNFCQNSSRYLATIQCMLPFWEFFLCGCFLVRCVLVWVISLTVSTSHSRDGLDLT